MNDENNVVVFPKNLEKQYQIANNFQKDLSEVVHKYVGQISLAEAVGTLQIVIHDVIADADRIDMPLGETE